MHNWYIIQFDQTFVLQEYNIKNVYVSDNGNSIIFLI